MSRGEGTFLYIFFIVDLKRVMDWVGEMDVKKVHNIVGHNIVNFPRVWGILNADSKYRIRINKLPPIVGDTFLFVHRCNVLE